MAQLDKKALKATYRRMRPPMGVLRIRCEATGEAYLMATPNLQAAENRARLQLDTGTHPDRTLCRLWKTHGASAFTFTVLDTLAYSKNPEKTDYRQDLAALLALWQEKIQNTP
nr:GIY-YIG nuclease family protein [Maliibacterium massiliense]